MGGGGEGEYSQDNTKAMGVSYRRRWYLSACLLISVAYC